MKPIIFIIVSVVIFINQSRAQDRSGLTFDECVSMALANNTDLKISINREKIATYNRQQTQWAVAPTVNGWGNTNLNFRRSTDQNNKISSGSSYNVGYGVNSSLTIFDGFTRINNIAAAKYNELVFKENTEYVSKQLYLQIIDYFVNVLYLQSMVKIAADKLETSKEEMTRIEATIEVGRLENAAIHEIAALVSGNKLEKIKIENSYKIALLQLSLLIEWNDTLSFNIIPSEFELTKPTAQAYTFASVYSMAMDQLPQIKKLEYSLQYYRKKLSVSKGNLSPSISIGAGYSSSFYSTDTLVNGKNTPFETQLTEYLNPNANISMNIPILNGCYNNIEIKKSKINVENALYELENQKKQIRTAILEIIQQLEAYLLEYENAKDNLVYAEKSHDMFLEKFRLGMINSTEFMTAQNQLAKAKSEFAITKLNWIAQNKIIELYTGKTQTYYGNGSKN